MSVTENIFNARIYVRFKWDINRTPRTSRNCVLYSNIFPGIRTFERGSFLLLELGQWLFCEQTSYANTVTVICYKFFSNETKYSSHFWRLKILSRKHASMHD